MVQIDVKSVLKKLADNGIVLAWVQDPVTKLPSVSLSNLILSILFVIVGILSNYFVFLKGVNASLCFDYFMISAGLYFGRKISFGSKSVTNDKVE